MVKRPRLGRAPSLLPCAVLGIACAGAPKWGAPDAAGSSADIFPLEVGFADVDITPSVPVLLWGQAYQRVANEVHDPLTATAMVLRNESGEQATLISVDLCFITEVVPELRMRLGSSIPGLDPSRIVAFATHTHTAPYLIDQEVAPAGVQNGVEYRALLIERLEALVREAWAALSPAKVGWAEDQAEVGFCRIVNYADGHSEMWGDPSSPNFSRMECTHDHRLEVLYVWDDEDRPRGVVVNVSSPSQVVEAESVISADFWGGVRSRLRAAPELGADFFVLPVTGASGDQAPRDLENPTPEQMGWPGLDRAAQRITDAVLRSRGSAEAVRTATPILRHSLRELLLPERSEWGGTFAVELHTLRIGDVGFVTNPFELYLDYGLQIRSESPAAQTFLAQLSSNVSGGYLPTAEALPGGAYGSRPENGRVGPEGGALLVEHSLETLNAVFR